tara:strand:+ start:1471 stop:1608 length:138 start_codon:yes stop_codon:yes gene_type:complete
VDGNGLALVLRSIKAIRLMKVTVYIVVIEDIFGVVGVVVDEVEGF